MVGTGPKGAVNELARVTIVDYHGRVIMDTYVKTQNPVVDCGLYPESLENGT
jgi:RNA exonuclease 4